MKKLLLVLLIGLSLFSCKPKQEEKKYDVVFDANEVVANPESIEDILAKPKSIEIKKNFENSVITCKLCNTCGFLKRLESKRK